MGKLVVLNMSENRKYLLDLPLPTSFCVCLFPLPSAYSYHSFSVYLKGIKKGENKKVRNKKVRNLLKKVHTARVIYLVSLLIAYVCI